MLNPTINIEQVVAIATPREAIIDALSVRWPGELCTLNRLASVSRQSKMAVYECVQQLFDETTEVEREYSAKGMPMCRWMNREGE
jgi:hypothetical protein